MAHLILWADPEDCHPPAEETRRKECNPRSWRGRNFKMTNLKIQTRTKSQMRKFQTGAIQNPTLRVGRLGSGDNRLPNWNLSIGPCLDFEICHLALTTQSTDASQTKETGRANSVEQSAAGLL